MGRFLTVPALLVAGLIAAAGPASAEAAPEMAQHKTTQAESFIMIEPIYSSILEGIRPRGLLLVEIGLDVEDPKLRAQVVHSLPVLRDAYVRSQMLYAATAVRIWRQPSVEDISSRMQAVTDQVMGRKGARVLMAQTAIRITR